LKPLRNHPKDNFKGGKIISNYLGSHRNLKVINGLLGQNVTHQVSGILERSINSRPDPTLSQDSQLEGGRLSLIAIFQLLFKPEKIFQKMKKKLDKRKEKEYPGTID
jgi:hypothetical protein